MWTAMHWYTMHWFSFAEGVVATLLVEWLFAEVCDHLSDPSDIWPYPEIRQQAKANKEGAQV